MGVLLYFMRCDAESGFRGINYKHILLKLLHYILFKSESHLVRIKYANIY